MMDTFVSKAEERALDAARRALDMLNVHIREDERGNIEGIDDVRLGLNIMASALARLFAYPAARDERNPSLDDVLAFLATQEKVAQEAVQSTADVLEGTGLVSYYGVSGDALAGVEKARQKLHQHLATLLSSVKQKPDDG